MGGTSTVVNVQTLEEAGVPGADGLLIRMRDGAAYRLGVVQVPAKVRSTRRS